MPVPKSVSVKICGINSAAAAEAVLRAGAEFGGLVFFAKSPRNLSLDEGTVLANRMRGHLKLVALVVDESDEALGRIAKEIRPDFFQLHGKETRARVSDIRSRFHTPVIKVLPVAEKSDLQQAAAYESVADMLMFDAKAPESASRPGGRGAAFDWQMLRASKFGRPWFLAGGLNPENVARAIAVSGTGLVDVSSGVESAPGVKSESLIGEFVAAARRQVAA